MSLLELNSISKSFGGVKAVKDVSFKVEQGEALGLVGPNGSGKSTCVNLICGVYNIDGGEIIFDGRKLTPKDDTKDRARLGLCRTFQTPRPFKTQSVYENVFAVALLGNDFDGAAKETKRVLEMTELYHYRDMQSSKLPIEKRKWLDLARILVTQPKIIMLDEAMAGLNSAEVESSIELVKRINREEGLTVIVIEHIMKVIMNICPRTVVLNEGNVLAEGATREVLNKPEVVKAYIGEETEDAES